MGRCKYHDTDFNACARFSTFGGAFQHLVPCHKCELFEPITNYDRIKAMNVEQLAAFLKTMVDENETHEVACYGCINYGTHHSDPQNKGTGLYECEGCSCEGIGHDLVKWLKSEAEENE